MKGKSAIAVITVAVTIAVIISLAYDAYQEELIRLQDIEKMPGEYTRDAFDQGTLEVITYRSTMIGTEKEKKNGSGMNTLTRRAMVYLPYGYDPDTNYDIMYIIHGRGGSYKTWLGTPSDPGQFKNVLDHMIEGGVIPPMIVVAPGLNYRYETDNKCMAGISHEIAYELMPAVESKYSTYAGGVDADSFAASRDHRIVAGFSMGGSATWHIMKNHIAWFRYFIPMSMAMYYDDWGYSGKKSIQASESIIASIKKQGYGPEDFEVYVATGEYDYKADAAYMQVYDLSKSEVFKYTDTGFSRGNITFKIWPNRWHSYRESFPYLYNALAEYYN